MEKQYINKKLLYGGLIAIVAFTIIGIIIKDNAPEEPGYTAPSPEETVKQYFNSWSNKNYPDMYAAISDGFKNIEPTAKDLASFKEYVSSQNIKEIKINNIKKKSNDGKTAQVDYEVELTIQDNTKKEFNGTFTLKYREADIIKGWKLIHPYGDKVDTA